MKRSYWLHITYHKGAVIGMQPQYSMTCASAPMRMTQGGAMQSAHFPSWEDLSAILSSVHCGQDELAKAKKSLDQQGVYTLTEVSLEDDQLIRLGFDPALCK